MQNTLDEFELTLPQRPVFLKVLCILTFIGSGLVILSNCFSYFNADKLFVQNSQGIRIKVDTINAKRADTSKSKFVTRLLKASSNLTKPENIRKVAVGNIIAAIFCLSGAFLMWRLKRLGYYIYIIGTLVGIFIPFYFFGNNIVTAFQTGIAGFIGVLFIILYGMNFKSLK